MGNMKIDYKDNIAILSEINRINDTNYWEIIEKEKDFAEKNIDFINIKIDVNNKETIFFLLDNNYMFKSKDSNFYILEKECQKDKTWRISLTEECNYRCFFCHEEGLEMGTKRVPKTKEEVYELIKLGIKNNYNDITFTGGEPLIKWKDVIWYLNKLNEDKLAPAITIVTNGFFVTDELLDAIDSYQAKNKFKFNFSMHSLNEEKYLEITKPKGSSKNVFQTVKNNIVKIKRRGITIKLNFVLLKDFNTTKDDIREILEFAYENDIDYIKFLELLVTEKLIEKAHYKYFFELNSLYEEWKNEFQIYKKAPRREVYLYKNKIKIELQQCTCGVGCAKCLLNRDINITAELKYFPCFLLSSKNFPVDTFNLLSKIDEGNKLIKYYGKEYGNSSPLLTRQKEYIQKKEEYYYISKEDLGLNEIDKILIDNKYKKYEKRDFSEIYYKPLNVDKSKYFDNGFIYKLFKNSSSSYYVEVIQDIKNFKDKFEIKFLNKSFEAVPKKIYDNTFDEYKSYIGKFGYEEFLKLDWETIIYRKGEKYLSIGFIKGYNKIIFMSPKNFEDNDIIQKLQLMSLNELPVRFITKT